jgi:glycosyl transferase family 87
MHMRPRPNRTLIWALLVALGTCYYYFDLLLPRARLHNAANAMAGQYDYGGDFYPIWLTGRELLFHGGSPYTPEMTRNIQTGLFGRPMDPRRPDDPPADFRAFSYPLYADLLAAPLLPLGFDAVRLVLGLLLPLLTAASLALWLRAFHLQVSTCTLAVATILVLVSYPVLEGLYAQQACLLVGAALAMSAALLARGRLALAGMLLALASVKPQLVWLLSLWLLLWAVSDWKRRRTLAIGFILTMSLLFLVSQFILPGWIIGWWHSLMGYSRYTLPPLTQLVLGRFLGIIAGLAMLALAGAICWRARRLPAASAGFSLTSSFVLTVTVLLAPTGGAVYDQVILIPAIVWLGFRRAEILKASGPMRVLALVAVVALCWQWLAACGVALASLISPALANNPSVLVFPTRMAAPLPFVLLALLSFFVVRILQGETDGFVRPLAEQG